MANEVSNGKEEVHIFSGHANFRRLAPAEKAGVCAVAFLVASFFCVVCATGLPKDTPITNWFSVMAAFWGLAGVVGVIAGAVIGVVDSIERRYNR